jgi:inhibitor of cysteine peptidase
MGDFMRRFFILVVAATLPICLMSSCAGEAKTYTDSGQMIKIGVNQEFVIALSSNPTTGYMWQESHDENMLKLVESKYEMGEEAKQSVVGAGGVELFRFKALKTGKTEITTVYKRAWEEEPIDQKAFTINIK